jgi:ribose transport system permease protein
MNTPSIALDDRGLGEPTLLVRLLRTRATWVLGFDIALFAIFTATSRNHVFFSVANAQNLLLGTTQALLLSLGLAMMLGSGIFDLSLGANLVLSSVVGALVIRSFRDASESYPNPWLAIGVGFAACVLAGTAYGIVNGLLIAVADINSLIATLATLGIGTGVAFLLADGADVAGMPIEIRRSIGQETILGIPLPAFFALLAAVVLWGVVRYTRFGLRTQAIGSSRVSAERAGIKVRRHYLVLTSLAGALAGAAGFVDLSRFGSTALVGHQNDSLAAVAAVVIGGTLLQGGYVSITGAVWGAGLAIILQQGLVISGVQSFWQLIVIGTVLLFAVVFDRVAAQRRASSR